MAGVDLLLACQLAKQIEETVVKGRLPTAFILLLLLHLPLIMSPSPSSSDSIFVFVS